MKRPFQVSSFKFQGERFRRAFTLIEMLAAMAVLSLITVMVAQLVSSSSLLAIGSRKRLDAEGQARLVLGRIGDDLARRLNRDDAQVLFANPSGNDAFYFYSEAPASFAFGVGSDEKSAVALVGYRINAAAGGDNEGRLERLGKGLQWSGTGASLILVSKDASGAVIPESLLETAWSSEVGGAPRYQNSTDTRYQILADGVIRLESAFLMEDGTLTQDPEGDGDGVTASLDGVAAIVVAIAVLDETSQKLTTPSQLAGIAGALSDPSAASFSADPPVLMAAQWQKEMNASGFAAAAGVPQVVASQIRVYQRIYPLKQ
jgi:prepilin-type N-terminal cleavage/methylation domain-containing protein